MPSGIAVTSSGATLRQARARHRSRRSAGAGRTAPATCRPLPAACSRSSRASDTTQPIDRADDHRDEPARHAARQPDVRGPRDQHDREAHEADPRHFPHLERRTHRDERDRDAGERAEHRRARRQRAHRGPTKAPSSTMTPMMKHQASPAMPGEHRVLGLQVHRQHDQEHDDEHVRHAGAVRHRRDVAAAFGLAELPREVRIEQVAERQRDAERRQDAAEHRVGGQLDDAEAEAGQDDDVEQDVGEQAEEAVPVARHPERDFTCAVPSYSCFLSSLLSIDDSARCGVGAPAAESRDLALPFAQERLAQHAEHDRCRPPAPPCRCQAPAARSAGPRARPASGTSHSSSATRAPSPRRAQHRRMAVADRPQAIARRRSRPRARRSRRRRAGWD